MAGTFNIPGQIHGIQDSEVHIQLYISRKPGRPVGFVYKRHKNTSNLYNS